MTDSTATLSNEIVIAVGEARGACARRYVAFVAIVIAAPASCGDSANPNGLAALPSDAQALPAGFGDEYCAKIPGTIASAFDACCSADDKVTARVNVGLYDYAVGWLPDCPRDIDARFRAKGRRAYRPAEAQQCFAMHAATYNAQNCSHIVDAANVDYAKPCRHMFVGLVLDGGRCDDDRDCVDGLTCIGHTASVEGICRRPPSLGAACGSPDASRNDPRYFDAHPICAPGGACDHGTCIAGAPEGASCIAEPCGMPYVCRAGTCSVDDERVADAASCHVSADCAEGLYCETAENAPLGTCRPKLGAGAACDASEASCHGVCDGANGGSRACRSFCGSL